jgi:hypothetical protein
MVLFLISILDAPPAEVEAFPVFALLVAEDIADRHRGVGQAQALDEGSGLAVGRPILALHLEPDITPTVRFDGGHKDVAVLQARNGQ